MFIAKGLSFYVRECTDHNLHEAHSNIEVDKICRVMKTKSSISISVVNCLFSKKCLTKQVPRATAKSNFEPKFPKEN